MYHCFFSFEILLLSIKKKKKIKVENILFYNIRLYKNLTYLIRHFTKVSENTFILNKLILKNKCYS